MVSLIDRALARARYISFCSNHDSGTALPPPSVRGLRRRGPVTSGFALSRPALSRRLRAVAHGNVAARRRARARARTPSGRRILSSCPAHLPSFAARTASSGSRPSSPRPSGSVHLSRTSAGSAGAPVPFARRPSARTGLRFLRARLRHEVPGFGAVLIARPAGVVTVPPALPQISARCPSRRLVARWPSPSEACSRPSGGSPSRLRLSA